MDATTPNTKRAQVLALLATGETIAALRIAARWQQLGAHKRTITRGWDAHTNPRLYVQLGQDPAQLTRDAVAALALHLGAAQ